MKTMTEAVTALLIHPDNTWEIREIQEDLPQLQALVGGYLRAVYTEHATLFVNDDGERLGLPINHMATYLWWKLQPEMEGIDHILGTCFVGGPVTDPNDPNMPPCSDEVIDLYKRMEDIRAKEED